MPPCIRLRAALEIGGIEVIRIDKLMGEIDTGGKSAVIQVDLSKLSKLLQLGSSSFDGIIMEGISDDSCIPAS